MLRPRRAIRAWRRLLPVIRAIVGKHRIARPRLMLSPLEAALPRLDTDFELRSLSHRPGDAAVSRAPTRRVVVVPCGSTPGRGRVARITRGCGSLTPLPLGSPGKPGPTASLLVACLSRRGAAPAGRGTRVALCGTGRAFATYSPPQSWGGHAEPGVRLAGASWVPALPDDGASGSVRDPPLLGDSGLSRAGAADGAPRVEGAGVAGA